VTLRSRGEEGTWPLDSGTVSATGDDVEVLALFLSGFVVGLAVSWAYIRSLKATTRTYQSYVHDRIDAHFDGKRAEEPPPAPHQDGS
jgi:hypothetical protein